MNFSDLMIFHLRVKMINLFGKSDGILGINDRNLTYIKPYNSAHAKRIADDKLLTKKVLTENSIETPKLVAEVKSIKQLRKINFSKLPGSIVLKPKKGFGGEGIIVFFSKDRQGNWLKADKTRYTERDLRNHIASILEGNFSLKSAPDTAFFEERILMHPIFKKYSYRGIPDIRIIVFNKVPVMAMLRLPTKESDGKANLHAGGIGVGIDLATGVTTTAVHHDKYIDKHPDSDLSLRGIKIPFWNRVLEMAIQTQICTNLGFLGVDIVIDRIKGPLILELNARPGLAIQIANVEGLKSRLERIKGLKIITIKRAIEVAKNLFGGEIEEEIEEVSGKRMVGRVEFITLLGKDGKEKRIKVKTDTGALWSSIDDRVASELGYGELIEEFKKFKKENPFKTYKEGRKVKMLAKKHFADHPEIASIALIKQSTGLDLRPMINIRFVMSGLKQKGKFTITHRKDLVYGGIIGRRSLRPFLIDISQKFLGE